MSFLFQVLIWAVLSRKFTSSAIRECDFDLLCVFSTCHWGHRLFLWWLCWWITLRPCTLNDSILWRAKIVFPHFPIILCVITCLLLDAKLFSLLSFICPCLLTSSQTGPVNRNNWTLLILTNAIRWAVQMSEEFLFRPMRGRQKASCQTSLMFLYQAVILSSYRAALSLHIV